MEENNKTLKLNAILKNQYSLQNNEYKIIKILGQGGFGITYLADDLSSKKEVVIKEYFPNSLAHREDKSTVLPASESESDFFDKGKERFIKEAQILAKFSHPNIARVIDLFEQNNTAYFVMNYEKGEDLQHYLKSNKNLSQEDILKIITPLLSALEEIHNQNIYHRDIKPENIYIKEDGEPMLIDFGSAKESFQKGSRASSMNAQTPGFSAPEQKTSIAKYIGAWTDIYALGATMYYMIKDKIPPTSSDREMSISEEDYDILVPLVEQSLNQYTEVFLQTIDKAMVIKRKNRIQNINEFRESLFGDDVEEEIEEEVHFEEEKQNNKQETQKESIKQDNIDKTKNDKQNNNFIKILATIGILVSIGISTLIYNNIQETKRIENKKSEKVEKQKEKEKQKKAKLEKQRKAKLEKQRKAKLEKQRKAYLIKHPIIRTFKGHTNTVNSVSPIPNTNKIISGSWDNTIKLWNINTGELIRTFKGHTKSVNSVSPIPNTNKIISGGDDKTIKLWNINTGELIRTFKGHTSLVLSVSPIPNTNKIISGSDDNTIKLWNINTGELIRTFKGHKYGVNSVSPIPNTNKIISGSGDNTIKLWNINTGELIRTFKGHTDYVYSVSPIPNTNKIISGGDDKTIKLWNINTGELIRTFKGHKYGVNSVSPIPNTNKIISGSHDNTIKLWNINTGELIRTFKGHTSYVLSVSSIPNTNKIISGSSDNTIKLWNINP